MPHLRWEDVLATAFLAGDWDPPAMADRARHALGRRGGWQRRLAEAARHAYPEPPCDRPRELARFLEACLPTVRGPSGPGAPLQHLSVAETAMGPAPWPVEPLDTVADLCDLVGLTPSALRGLADPGHRERSHADERLRNYRYRWVAKRSGGSRLLEAPKPRLRHVQRVVLRAILGPVPVHHAVHGFRPGRSALTNAGVHAGGAAVVRLDLADFFSSVSAGRAFGVFRACGYPEPVAHLLTALVTNTVPPALRAPPGGLAPPARALREALAGAHLPQGAPTSPAVANLVGYRLDRRLQALADKSGLRYTRYADDLALSSTTRMGRRRATHLLRQIDEIVDDEGFIVNRSKTAVMRAGDRQRVTGLVVNERPNVCRVERDRLEATLVNAARYGPTGQNRDGVADFRSHLLGRVAWVTQVNPQRGQRLQEIYDRIDWTGPPA